MNGLAVVMFCICMGAYTNHAAYVVERLINC